MSNDLMRDYLDGKIHVRKPFKPGRIYIAPVGLFLDSKDSTGWTELGDTSPDWTGKPWTSVRQTEPADPRERALRAKQERGHGPDVGALKERGRVTKYQTKG